MTVIHQLSHRGRSPEKRVWLLLVIIAGLLAGYSYYFHASDAAEVPEASAGSPGAASLHFTSAPAGGSGIATSGYEIPTSVLDGDFTLKITLKSGDFDAASGHYPYLTLENQDGLRRFRFGHQNSPYAEMFMYRGSMDQGAENSPGGMTETMYHFAGTDVYDTTFAKGSISRQVYSDYWLVYKRPTAQTDGYLRAYRNGDLVRATASSFVNYSLTIPAGSNTDWTGDASKPFRIRLGSPDNPVQDFKIAELSLWTATLDDDQVTGGCDAWAESNPRCDTRDWGTSRENRIADPGKWTLIYSPALRSLSKRPIALASPVARRDAALYCDFYVTDASVDGSSPVSVSAGNGPNDLGLVKSASSSLSSDVPSDWPEWGKASGKEGPQNLSLAAEVAGDTAIHVSTMALGNASGNAEGLPLKRKVYVSKSEYLYGTAFVYQRTVEQGADSFDVTGLEPGTQYYVVGEWEDPLENKGTSIVPLRTSGSRAALSSAKESLHLSGTAPIPSSNFALPVNEPFTMRVYLKRGTEDTGVTGKVIELQDSLGTTTGYTRFNLGVSGTSYTFAMTDGSKTLGGYSAMNAFTAGVWTEVWIQYNPPTAFSPGSMRLLKGTQVLVSYPLSAVSDWYTDWDFKKFKLHLRVGDESVPRDVYIGPMAWWSRYLDDNEIAALSGKDLGQLTENERYENDLYWYAQPTNRETSVTPDLGASKGAQDISIPLAGNSLAFSTDYPVLSGPAPDLTPPSSGVLSLSGNPEPSTVGLHIPIPDQSAVRRVVHLFKEKRLSRRFDRVGQDLVLTGTTATAQVDGLVPDFTYYAYATYYDESGNHTDSSVFAFTTAGAVTHTLSLQVLLKGRVASGGTLQTADHSHDAVGLELRNENGTALSPAVACYATNSSVGVVTLSTTGGGCGALLSYLAEHEGNTFSMRVRPTGYLYQSVPVSSTNLDGDMLTFPQPFSAGSFSATATGEKVELADFSILASYYNGGTGTPGVIRAYQSRTHSALLNEFAVLAHTYNSQP